MTVSAADSQKQRGQTTEYVILGCDSSGYWRALDTRDARSSNEAIRFEAGSLAEGVKEYSSFVAVPSRSWKPQKVTVEQTTVVKVGEPT